MDGLLDRRSLGYFDFGHARGYRGFGRLEPRVRKMRAGVIMR